MEFGVEVLGLRLRDLRWRGKGLCEGERGLGFRVATSETISRRTVATTQFGRLVTDLELPVPINRREVFMKGLRACRSRLNP